MKDKRSYKIFLIGFYLLLSVIAIVMTFRSMRHQSTDTDILATTAGQQNETQAEKEITTDFNEENDIEPEPELYQEGGNPITIYFTNTEELDNGYTLPVAAQTRLVQETQDYLNGRGIHASELRINGSIVRTDTYITFRNQIVGQDKVLIISYDMAQSEFSFEIEGGRES